MIFISYARADATAVEQLHRDLDTAHLDPWRDVDLTGGQRWWDVILERVAACDAFLFALSPAAVTSRACLAELEWAVALDRPLLPTVVEPVAFDVVPEALATVDAVDVSARGAESAIRLMTALRSLPVAPSLPSPRPRPPDPPIADLEPLREAVHAPQLDLAQQQELIATLFSRTSDADLHAPLAELADRLGARLDFMEALRPDLDRVHDRLGAATGLRIDASIAARRSDLVRAANAHIDSGKFTPILGYGLTDRLIGSRSDLADTWAEGFEFPLSPHRRTDFAGVAQFVSVMTGPDALLSDLHSYLRRHLTGLTDAEPTSTRLTDLLRSAWRADDDPNEPHRVLARLECPLYINASPWGLLADALRDEGRSPEVDRCRWRPDVYDWPESPFDDPAGYVPTVDRPLVYHVFGDLDVPDSLAVTEDDYLDFMLQVTKDRSLIPNPVWSAVADSALLLLGFDLQDWDVRILAKTLIGQEGSGRLRRYRHVAAQVDPSSTVVSPIRAKQYLERWFGQVREPAMDIYWGSVEDFALDLTAAQTGRPG